MHPLGRFGLHLAAAVGATGVFFAAVAVGAQQEGPPTADPPSAVVQSVPPQPASTPSAARKQDGPTATAPTQTPTRPVPERSLSGTIREVAPDAIVIVQTARERQWRVSPLPGALIKLNGRAAKLDGLQAGDRVVILGQVQDRERFVAHAITARRR
jgi:hypothetical protein